MGKSKHEHRMTDTAGRRTRILGGLRSADGTGVVHIEAATWQQGGGVPPFEQTPR
jgi:hypothetical protein